jgi:hypothetical protein
MVCPLLVIENAANWQSGGSEIGGARIPVQPMPDAAAQHA